MPGSGSESVPSISMIGGTGKLGPGLALRLAQAGLPVLIGSRDPARAEERAAELNLQLAAAGGGAEIRGTANARAAVSAGLVILTVPHDAQVALLPELAGALEGRTVVSTAVPLRFDPVLGPVAEEVGEGSAAEQVATLLPESRVVAGFHTVSSSHLGRLDQALSEDVLICGDDAEAKAEVQRVTELIPGLRVVDAGRLGNSRLTEQLTVLLLGINRRTRRHTGIRLTGL